MIRRVSLVFVWSLLAAGCDDDQPQAVVDAGPVDMAGDASIDAFDPPPDRGARGRVRIVSPMDGARFTGADDLDDDANSGVRIAVQVEAEGTDDGQVRILVEERDYIVDVVDGQATTVVALPSAEQQRVRIRAEIVSDGEPRVNEVEVIVAVREARLTVEPFPGGGCDFGTDADLDPDRPGIQRTLRVAGEALDSVELVVTGGQMQVFPVEGPSVDIPTTFADGQTEIRLIGRAADARDSTLGPLIYGARTTPSRIVLGDITPEIYGLADAEMIGERAVWRFTGASSGFEPGAALDVEWQAPLPGGIDETIVDADGRFTLEVGLAPGQFWRRRVTVRGVDGCGSEAAAEALLSLDAVVPTVRIVDPAPGSRLSPLDDAYPERPFTQVAFTVEIDDPRPDDDYRLSLWCAAPGEEPEPRGIEPGDETTRLAEPRVLIGNFRTDETGRIECSVRAEGARNGAQAVSAAYDLFFERPLFSVAVPTVDDGCSNDSLITVQGQGRHLAGNDPSLTVVAVDAAGNARDPIPLEPLGDEVYGARLDQAALPDGAWTLRVQGTVLDGLPIIVFPEEIPLVVDRVDPTLEFLAPTRPFLADEDPATAGFQTAVRVRVCGAAGETLAVAADGFIEGAPYAEQVPVPAGDCADLDLPPFTAPLGPISLTATARDACGNGAELRVRTRIDPAAIGASIISPTDGSGIDAGVDAEPARAGCQVDLEGLIAGPGPEARVVVCTAVDQGRPAEDCLGQDSALAGPCVVMGVADAGTTVRCPLTLTDGTHSLTLAAIGNARIESAPVQVRADCSPPTVQQLVIEQDLDGNGCLHRQERANAADASDEAQFTAVFTVDGIQDGASVRLRTEGGVDLGVAALADGAGRIDARLPPGVHRLYLRGQDAVGNRLPEPGEAGITLRPIEIDTRPPTPTLIGLDGGECLGVDDDTDVGRPGLQRDLSVSTGRAADESVAAALLIDGVEVERRRGAVDRVDFAGDLPDGDRALAVLVTDTCGNVGSVAGFESAGGLPDWDRPRGVSLRVDTVPPGLALVGIDDGAVLTAEDDADGDPGDGFQLDLAVQADPAAPLEAGRPVELWINDARAATDPPALTVPADFDGLLPARLTMAAGLQRIEARAIDACGNGGASTPVAVTVDVEGCASRFVGFAENPAVRGDTTPFAIEGAVDLIDPRCAGARAELVIDGAPGPVTVVGPDGRVRFDGVELDPGGQTLTLRIGPVAAVTLDSPPQQIIIDPLTPTVALTRPAGPDPASLLTDDRPDLQGQQVTIIAAIDEARVDTPRRARLTIGGRAVDEQPVPDSDPATVQFADVTVPSGRQTLEVCVIDAAANVGCGRRIVDADPAPPGSVAPVEVAVVDPRETAVELRFTAPGDDGALGAVTGYALRRADAVFVDEADWAAAAASEIILPPTVDAGRPETLTLRGPGPTLAEGLSLNRSHAVAIRALDDVGQPGPLVSVTVDLRLTMASGDVPSRSGAWSGGDVLNTTSPAIGVGDLDGDGFDDVLLAVSQLADATGAALVFGGEGDFETRALDLAPGMGDAFFGAIAAASGDLNGDGAPDMAVQGYLDGFAGAAVALYFGCTDPCDRAEVIAPDALVVTVGGRFTNSLAGVGDVWRPTGAGFDDLLVGGSLGDDTDAFVIAGRAEWPALPDAVRIGPGGDGVDVARLITPEGPTAVYAAGLGDLDGDGFDDIGLSAGGAINTSYVFYGGPWPGAVAFAEGDPDTVRLVDPCPAANPSFGTAFVGGADLDGDGRPDFAVGNRANKRIVVFGADRAALDCFGRSPVQYGRFFDLAGDIDGDGFIDLVATHGDPAVPAAHIFYNDGLGRFGVGAMVSPRGADVVLDMPARTKLGIAGAGDVNGDGRADVAAVVLDGDAMRWIVYY